MYDKTVLALPCASRHKNIHVQIHEHFELIINAVISSAIALKLKMILVVLTQLQR
jgi:hypothetical protein